MNESRFWSIIDFSRQRARGQTLPPGKDFNGLHERTLAEDLERLTPDEIAAFNDRFWTVHRLAYKWDLWAVAYWMHGGCSDDGFTDFRACLVSLGQDLFTMALKDADSLADVIGRPDTPYMQAEGFQYIAGRVYKRKTGEEMPLGPSRGGRREPEGTRIDMDDEEVMRKHFPKLLKKMPEMGD